LKQPSLFETPKEEGYPIIMRGYWKSFLAFALVDTKEKQKELEAQGYEVEAMN
jgi:hypothetical protein